MRPLASPLEPTGGLVILRGNLAPDGCVVKVAGDDLARHEGPARMFDTEEAAFAAVEQGAIRAGDVVVIRNEGPTGGPRIGTDETRREVRRILADVRGGTYAKKWLDEDRAGRPWFNATRERERAHPIEQVGAELR